jgi:D-alanyl-D-alanine carboxypeptidase/D-alanyl-D-alanine-endopeptidase (penicillin-binding protein 4)
VRSPLLVALCLFAAACGGHRAPSVTPQPPSPAERQLAADLSSIFGANVMAQAQWGVEVRSLDSGRTLFALNPDKLLMPASNMKIVTLAAPAGTLGWDYRFATTLETAAPIEAGVLAGDLVVRGTGDPTINTRNGRAAQVFDEWASALKAAGISRIDGNIVGDDNAFDDAWLGAGWAWDYLQYDYAAPVGALEYNEDFADLVVTPGTREGDPVFLELTPGSGLRLFNRAVTGPVGSTTTLDYVRHLEEPVLEVTGTVPEGATPLRREVAVVNPTIFFVQALKDALIARGIEVTGRAVDGDDLVPVIPPAERRALARLDSPPLSDIAAVLMKVSQNLYAETLLKAVGAAHGGLGTTEGGRLATHALLASWGVPDSSYVQVDGSGLSRYDYVTADVLVTILSRLYADEAHRAAFLATFPIAGRDGTMEKRLRKTRAEGNALAKTGSIANVRTLSGFVRTRDGEMLAFSILGNNFAVPGSTVTWIADLAVETLSNFKR